MGGPSGRWLTESKTDLARTLCLPRKQVRSIIDRYRVTDGKDFRLKDFDPADTTRHLLSHAEANTLLAESVQRLAGLQEKLYAQDRWAMLCVLQAMDCAGKDGTIKHVMSGVNPQGVEVTSFKTPGPEALAHDFFWRANRALPARGAHRHFQPQPLRGGARSARARQIAPESATAEGAC